MSLIRSVPSRLRRFSRDEQGSMTLYGISTFAACCALGAVGMDVTHFYAAQTQLQVAADAAAHAALYNRRGGKSDGDAKAAAIGAVEYAMAEDDYGTVLDEADIVFGTWNATAGSFEALEPGVTTVPSAVRVVTNRADENPVGSFLFRIVGVDQMDVRTAATYTTYSPGCLTNGFAGKLAVSITSGNQFFDDFCIHSNVRVELNNSNGFEPGTVVSMPDKSDVKMPPAGWTSNDGINEALRDGEYDFRILDRIETGTDLQVQMHTMSSVDQERFAPWLTSGVKNTVTLPKTGSVNLSNFTKPAGSWYDIQCTGNESLTMEGGTYQDMILTTNCPIKMSGQVILDQAIISTTSDDVKSVSANSSGGTTIQIGRFDEHCQSGGGAAIITRGGVSTSAGLSFYGGQILALKEVSFTSHVEGYGASIITAGAINGTTDIDAHGCPDSGMEDAILADYFRLVQ